MRQFDVGIPSVGLTVARLGKPPRRLMDRGKTFRGSRPAFFLLPLSVMSFSELMAYACSLKSRQNGVSSGKVVWHTLHARPVCLEKLAVACACGVESRTARPRPAITRKSLLNEPWCHCVCESDTIELRAIYKSSLLLSLSSYLCSPTFCRFGTLRGLFLLSALGAWSLTRSATVIPSNSFLHRVVARARACSTGSLSS